MTQSCFGDQVAQLCKLKKKRGKNQFSFSCRAQGSPLFAFSVCAVGGVVSRGVRQSVSMLTTCHLYLVCGFRLASICSDDILTIEISSKEKDAVSTRSPLTFLPLIEFTTSRNKNRFVHLSTTRTCPCAIRRYCSETACCAFM